MGFLRKLGNFVTFGALDKHEAKKITRNSKNREDDAREELEVQRERTQSSLENLGNRKTDIYSNSISDFVEMYETIGKVDLKPLKNTENYISKKKYKQNLLEMKTVSAGIKDLATTAGAGALGGAIAVGGAWGLATIIGTASTGTAIGTLSGAVATNATLAWLGGGAISAGGAGMAGGMIVLGGVALAPIAIVAMFMGTQKGKQKLNAALDYSDQVDVLVERIKTLISELAQIQRGALLVENTLLSIDEVMKIKNEEMNNVIVRLESRTFIKKYGIDPVKKLFNIDLLTEDESQIVVDTVNCASLLRQIIDMPLLDGEGAFLGQVFEFIENEKSLIDSMLISNEFPQLHEVSVV